MATSPKSVRFDDDSMWVELEDGRLLGVPLAWFPRLLRATPEQRAGVELSKTGLHWEAVDEDIAISGLLAGRGEGFAVTDNSAIPDVLYHYTDQHGLIGILSKREFWLTNLSHLNDASEYFYSRDLCIEMLSMLENDGAQEGRMREYAAFFKEFLRRQYEQCEGLTGAHEDIYVASFSTEQDDLSQWRAYGKTGSRFCIGFRAAALTELGAANHCADFGCIRVNYDRSDALVSLKRTFVTEMKSLAPELGIGPDRPVSHGNIVVYWALIRKMLQVGLREKHSKFFSESEVRIHARFGRSEVRYRPGRSFVIPYAAIDLSIVAKPIVSIMVGPTPHASLSEFSVKSMVSSYGWDSSRISLSQSQIPYRDW